MTFTTTLAATDERRPRRSNVGIYQVMLIDLRVTIFLSQSQKAVLRIHFSILFVLLVLVLVLALDDLLSERGEQRSGAELFFEVLPRGPLGDFLVADQI